MSDRVRILQDFSKTVCVMGNGTCKTHNMKLKKSVRSKKMSCVIAGGDMSSVPWESHEYL